MLKNDWMVNQVNQLVRMVANIVFQKNSIEYEINEESSKEEVQTYNELRELLEKGLINQGEDLLFERVDTEDLNYLKMGIDYYTKVNDLEENQLENYKFSRKEIKMGIEDLLKEFGINITV